jgi:hypothetical protein
MTIHCDREKILIDLGPNPTCCQINSVLNAIVVYELKQRARELADFGMPIEKIVDVINRRFVPEYNAWKDEQLAHILRCLEDPDVVSTAKH